MRRASDLLAELEDERLLAKIRKVFVENYECYGVRRMHAALLRDGERVGRDQVARLMRTAGMQGREASREAVADHDRRSRGAQAS